MAVREAHILVRRPNPERSPAPLADSRDWDRAKQTQLGTGRMEAKLFMNKDVWQIWRNMPPRKQSRFADGLVVRNKPISK